MCSLFFSTGLIPDPPSSLDEVGLGTAEGRGAPGGKERALPLSAPPLHLSGHPSPSTPGLRSFVCSLPLPGPPWGLGINPLHRRAVKARGGGVADSDALSVNAGSCTSCRIRGGLGLLIQKLVRISRGQPQSRNPSTGLLSMGLGVSAFLHSHEAAQSSRCGWPHERGVVG